VSSEARVPGSATRSAEPLPAAIVRRPPPDDDPSRALLPSDVGFVSHDGVRIYWEAYGSGPATILLLPSWSIAPSRVWKAQIPFLARRNRVVTFDGRGNGRSDRPTTADSYSVAEFAADALAVLDAVGSQSVVLVSLSMGVRWSLLMAAHHPERVAGAVFISPAIDLSPPGPTESGRLGSDDEELDAYEGWDKYNRHYWRLDYPGFLEFFFGECLSEPHSTKQIEDCVGWGLGTDAETLILIEDAPGVGDHAALLELIRAVRCPVLVIHGSDDRIISHAHGAALARETGGRLLTFEGSGHLPQAREPVRTNLAIRDFVDEVSGARR
jgi:pimeloyl-ACP methyl ester carboxylesterase